MCVQKIDLYSLLDDSISLFDELLSRRTAITKFRSQGRSQAGSISMHLLVLSEMGDDGQDKA